MHASRDVNKATEYKAKAKATPFKAKAEACVRNTICHTRFFFNFKVFTKTHISLAAIRIPHIRHHSLVSVLLVS